MLRQRAVCLQFNVTVFYSLNTIPTHGLYCLHISVMYSSVATVRSIESQTDCDVDRRSAGRGLSKMAAKVNTSATIGATTKSELSLEFADSEKVVVGGHQ